MQHHKPLNGAGEHGLRERGYAADMAGGGEVDDKEVRAMTRRAPGADDGILRAHDLEIDTATREVKRRGRHVRLTPREYDLLEFLARHRGRVVSRAVIWSNLYDEHDAGTSNVIDVYIRYLRRKIDRGHELPLILTRRGAGYMLRADDA